ncbi:MAG: hypothetical protein AUH29_06340 [Candidatus Rokubacteria bacterium 13_1_40CM_69_27]|nr:MAG: hypothetical protein AUH29_06340 [Candidatus Rokubacteria bacterium 13_1_40CM_69_27]
MAHRLDKGRSTVDAVTIQKSLKIGVGGTDLKKLVVYSVTLSPAAVAANTTAEQTFTVTGVAVGEVVLEAVKPTVQAGLGIAGARVTATNTIGILFMNDTAGSITPTASEAYKFVVLST